MTYDEALQYLNGLIRFGVKLDLGRFRLLCDRMENPQSEFQAVHVGGTNGKGSTTAMCASILRSAGYKTGTYLSPYVHDVRERIQVDGEMIPKADFAAIMERIIPHLEAVAATDAGQPTEFEAKTLIAFLYFAQMGVDFACVEVGMGGRFDATNVLDPVVSVITNVSLDHMERLGDTIEKIAFEKAGIIKLRRPVVTAAEDPAWRVISEVAAERKAPIYRVCPDCGLTDAITWNVDDDGLLFVTTPNRAYSGLALGLPGAFQYPNAACAIGAVELIEKTGQQIGETAIRQGLAQAYIPGRLEVLRRNPTVIIDGAHNPDAATRLAEAIKSTFKYRNLLLVAGMLSTHSATDFLAQIAPLAKRIIVTAPDWPLARPAKEIAEDARAFCENVTIVEPVQAAVDAALAEAEEEDLVLVTGSFYVIGEVSRHK
jgi:dihydrofolate synthase / folylpolyglutamate synthase